MGVDFAMSSTVQADYTVVWVMGTDKHGNRWIMDIRREKGLPFQNQLSLINEVAKLYQPGLVFLESNQMQRIFGDELIRTTDLPIKKFITGVQKNSLDKGVPSLRVLLENGKFRIPRGDKRSVELTNEWINEMRNFTWHDGKLQGVGSHDDLVMACWVCDQAIRQGAFSFDFGGDSTSSGIESSVIETPSIGGKNGVGTNGTATKATGNLVGAFPTAMSLFNGLV
jgi:phage terminase large subunit-like protein